ncbi:hypothetical protein JQC67_15310 [Aurantibacter crassamenti]|uniref:hypothetical protein n=1 Tax=Aurantibacter crassamenti TaxID=1837375 RepID=UPI0019393B36|nr:hypothetical protein [Aurantibacter crassamenti]MBM1107522.1 hypothetical protein [Aurantibacter crassamenti]
MKKWINWVIPLVVVLVLVSYGFTPKEVKVPESLKVTEPMVVDYPKREEVNLDLFMIAPPFLGTSFIGFREALAFKESQGNYFTTNTLGYLGKYQFGIGTLQLMGVYNATRFLNNPKLQEEAFQTNIARNKWILRRDIARFEGKYVAGVEVTESGILAAAHLAGPGNVKKYLRSYGAIDFEDTYGTSMSHYMRKFSGYDVSHVSPVRNPKVPKI